MKYPTTEKNIGRSDLIILRFVARKEVRLSGLDGHIFGLGQKWRECKLGRGLDAKTREMQRLGSEGRLASATA